MGFQAFLSFDVYSWWFLPLSQELPLTASPADSRNLMLPGQVIEHEQQQYSGGLLFLLSPLDDAVIEAPSCHPHGLAAHTYGITDLL